MTHRARTTIGTVVLVAGLPALPLAAAGPVAQAAEGARAWAYTCQGREITVLGTVLDDDLRGTSGPDVIAGGPGNDTVRGLGGDDVICGGADQDTLDGGAGADSIDGGGADFPWEPDLLAGGPGHDVLRGRDLAMVDFRQSAVAVDVDLPAQQVTGEGDDELIGITGVYGSPFGDHIVADGTSELVSGWNGPDVIDIGAGPNYLLTDGTPSDAAADTVRVGPRKAGQSTQPRIVLGGGADRVDLGDRGGQVSGTIDGGVIRGGDGNDSADLTGPFTAYGGPGGDYFIGRSEPIRAYGGADGDYLAGSGLLEGGPSRDVLEPAVAGTVAHGGSGANRLIVTWPDGAHTLDLELGTVRYRLDGAAWTTPDWSGFGDYVSQHTPGTVTLKGTDRRDIFYIDDRAVRSFTGDFGAGDDDIYVDANTWRIDAGAGDDEVWTRFGGGTSLGGPGDDELHVVAFTGDSVLVGGPGADDLVGSDGDDRLFGGDGDDRLRGYDGDDELFGNGGDDRGDGGEGQDVCRLERRVACES